MSSINKLKKNTDNPRVANAEHIRSAPEEEEPFRFVKMRVLWYNREPFYRLSFETYNDCPEKQLWVRLLQTLLRDAYEYGTIAVNRYRELQRIFFQFYAKPLHPREKLILVAHRLQKKEIRFFRQHHHEQIGP